MHRRTMLKTLLASPVSIYIDFPAESSITSQSRFSEAEIQIIKALMPIIQFDPRLQAISIGSRNGNKVYIHYYFKCANGPQNIVDVRTESVKSDSIPSVGGVSSDKINTYFNKKVILV